MNAPITCILAAVLFATAGCVPPRALRVHRQAPPVVDEPSDEEIAQTLSAVPRLDLPIRAAVCLMNYGDSLSRSDEASRQLAQALKEIPEIAEIALIHSSDVEGELTPHSIRLAAAARHADAVLMFWCDCTEIKIYDDTWEVGHQIVANAALIDTRTGSVLYGKRQFITQAIGSADYALAVASASALDVFQTTIGDRAVKLAMLAAERP